MTSNYLTRILPDRCRLLTVLFAILIAAIVYPATSHAHFRLSAITELSKIKPWPLVRKIHVFGKDDRVELPEKHKHLRTKIGLLLNSATNFGCTASCVAPDVILTAAHCVLKAAKRKRFPDTTGLKFLLWSSKVPDVRIGTDVLYSTDLIPRNVIAGSPISKVFSGSSFKNFKQDWAFIKLQRKMCGNNSIPLKSISNLEIAEAAKAGKILEVGYHGDREFGKKLLYTDKCQIKDINLKKNRKKPSKNFKPIRHTCDLFQGASGAPMMIDTGSELAIVAINVAEYSQQKYLKRGRKIIKRYRAKALYNLAVNVSDFSKYLPLLRSSSVFPYEFQLKQVQQMLKDGKLYLGKIDGIFGPATWRAIRKFEKSKQKDVLGLPTVELRDALQVVFPQ